MPLPAVIYSLPGEYFKGFFVRHNVLQTNGANKDGSEMAVPVENRMCPSGFKEREVGSVRNLTCLYMPYVMAGGSSTVRQ